MQTEDVEPIDSERELIDSLNASSHIEWEEFVEFVEKSLGE